MNKFASITGGYRMNDYLIDDTYGAIAVESTSKNSADATPIVLRETESLKLWFSPKMVNNANAPERSVEGKLIYERKKKSDSEFPSAKIARGNVKSGELMEISLNTLETHNLFRGIQDLYSLYAEHGIPSGSASYIRADQGTDEMLKLIQDNPGLAAALASEENRELFLNMIALITSEESYLSLVETLQLVENEGIERLSSALNIGALTRLLAELEDNLGNSDEAYWQSIFVSNGWILSQLFASPYSILSGNMYIGGKGIANTGGHYADFIYKNKLTGNVAIIEIKNPATPIVGNLYRNGVYPIHAELSGAISQVIKYKDSLTKEFVQLAYNSTEQFSVFSPKCFVVAGAIASLDLGQTACFESYRAHLSGIEIITFDELIERVKAMINLFESNANDRFDFDSSAYSYDTDIPF
jgi:hypothetical protein